MARGVNKVILIGNLGADPEVRYTQGGTPIANLRLATSESWTDRQTNERREQTEWHRVVCFTRLAEIAGEYLRKGARVYIEGNLRTRQWERDGQTHYTTEIVAREMQMLDGRNQRDGGGPAMDDGFEPAGMGGDYGSDRGGESAPAARGGVRSGSYGGRNAGGSGGGAGGGMSGGGGAPRGAGRPAPAPAEDFDDDIPF